MQIASTRLMPVVVALLTIALAVLVTACGSDDEDPTSQAGPTQKTGAPGTTTLTPGSSEANPELDTAPLNPMIQGHPDFATGDDGDIVITPISVPDIQILAAPGGFGVPDLPDDNCTPNYLLDTSGGDPVDERLTWWTATPPDTGPITEPFVCEFSVALTTIVGSEHVGDINEQLPDDSPYRRVEWPAAGASPNRPPPDPDDRGIPVSVPSEERVDFVVRTTPPGSRPRIQNLTNINGIARDVLVNRSQSGALPDLVGSDEFEFRPSLWIEFKIPQRAVGIEYGIDADDAFDGSGIRLIGYDINGNEIVDNDSGLSAASDGKARAVNADSSFNPTGPEVGIGINNLSDRVYTHPIGIRDSQGRIATVELRFDWFNADEVRLETAPPEKVKGPQAVTRIWYEPLPPVAVKQGVAGIESSGSGFADLYDVPPGPVTEPLPFEFDRALVFLRGVRFMLLDSQPREISELSAFINQNSIEFPRSGNRSVVIAPSGNLTSSPAKPFRIVTYYTLLAWDSRQVTLHNEPGSTGLASFAEREQEIEQRDDTLHVNAIFASNPCSSRRCPALFGGLTSVRFVFDSPAEIKKLYLMSGAQRFLSGGVESPMLERHRGGTVAWGFNTDFEGKDDEIHSFEANGHVIAGPSLVIGPADASELDNVERAKTSESRTKTGFTFCETNTCEGQDGLTGPNAAQRRIPQDELNGTPENGWQWPVIADAAFLGYSVGHVYPDNKIRELDWEFWLNSYDGHIADWRMGFGIDTKSASDDPDERPMFGIPNFGGVVRHDINGLDEVDTEWVDVRNGVVGLTTYGDGNGYIRNTDNLAPLEITSINRPSGSDNDLFEFIFMVPRHHADDDSPIPFVRLEENEFSSRLPYLLRPGATIRVNARYTPDEPAFFGDPPATPRHTGRLVINTASLRHPRLSILASGEAAPADPAGEWRPDSLTFINGTMEQEKFAFLLATGGTPLVVNNFYLADPSSGFVVTRRPSIENDVAVFSIKCGGTENPPCSASTQLIADTNAGLITLDLIVVTP